MKLNTFILIVLFGLGVNLSFNVSAALTSVPGILSAPVILYDDNGNILSDGHYGVVITLQDEEDVILFQEHQDATVINGVAALTIGIGEEVSGEFASSGGLSDDLFLAGEEIRVEIAVDGQSFAQEVAVLGSQPYSFVSNYALNVAPDTVTGSTIRDGSITANDLEPSFLSQLQKSIPIVLEEGGSLITAENILVNSEVPFEISDAATLDDVLQDFDGAITNQINHSVETSGIHGVSGDVVGTNDAQSLTNKNLDATNVVSGFAIKSGVIGAAYIDGAIARDADLSFSNLSGVMIESQIPSSMTRDSELVFSNISGSVSDAQVPSSIARDSELAFSNLSGSIAESQIPSSIARDSEISASVNPLSDRVKNLENDTITVSEVPTSIRPFAYGTITRPSGGSCSGYNMDSDCTFTSNSADANYQVVMTPLSALTCGTYAGTCYVASKSSSSFALACACPSGGTLSPQIDFVVYRK